MSNRLLAALICILAVASQARAAQWFSLEVGDERRFVDPHSGDTTFSTTTMVETIRDREVYRIENEVKGESPQTYWNYWSIDGEGQLLLHGFRIGPEPDAYGRYYEPPIIYAASAPTEGATWSTTFETWERVTGESTGILTVTGQNYGVELLELAVGSFEALLTVTNGEDPPLRLQAGNIGVHYSLLGRQYPQSATRLVEADAISWWVQGIGEVQRASFNSDNVTGTITFASVPIEEDIVSSSQLKASFMPRD